LSSVFKRIFIIGFLIFFLLQSVFVAIIAYKNYKEYKYQYDLFIRSKIELTSYKLKSDTYKISFIKADPKLKLLKFYKTDKEIFMLFKIPFSKKFYLKISLPIDKYNHQIEKIKMRVFREFMIYIVGVFFLSIVFTFILLLPIKKAYELNEVFIKDILHDFNTPISSIRINLYLLKKLNIENKYLKNIDLAIKIILNLEQNLKLYLLNQKQKPECFLLDNIINEKIDFYSQLYPYVKVINHIKGIKIYTDKFAFERIIDNILSNAFKYNKKNGMLHICKKWDCLIIKDTGKGIKEPSNVFKKFYKENERGLGIGLNIVYKFSKMLKIPLILRSIPKKGTTVILDLKNKSC